MTSRREFLRGVGGAAGGAFLAGYGLGAGAQSARREITLNGRRITTVDIHAHCIFPEVREVIAGSPLDGRAFPEFQMLGPDRLEQMNSRGIDYQALSMTIQGHWWYAADRSLAARIVRASDDALAVWVEQHPDRFVALSSVALPYPDLAAEQLEYAVTELGARGASIGGQVNGEYPSSERFDPFWAKVVELDVPVFMHPALGAHGGGYLPSYLGRTEVACDRFADANCLNTKMPSEYLRDQIFVDSMIFSEEGLRHLVAEMGASQVVYGTDMPFPWPETLGLILDSPSLDDAEKEAIAGGNLIRLLQIDV